MSTPNDWNKSVIEEFRANAGKVGGPFAGRTLLLLHTIGAKSKQERINPVGYFMDGDRFVIIASKGGAPTNPGWYHNLRANPGVSIEVGTEKFQVQATFPGEPERTRLYDHMAANWSSFADYQQKTKRIIPVVVLTRTK
jgi:deazaflavin-dependent oxidoreductase (nitroreductase family)